MAAWALRVSILISWAGILQAVLSAAAGQQSFLRDADSSSDKGVRDGYRTGHETGTAVAVGRVFQGLPAFSSRLTSPARGGPLIRERVEGQRAPPRASSLRSRTVGASPLRLSVAARARPDREAEARRIGRRKAILEDNLVIQGKSKTQMQHAITLVETESGDILGSWFGGLWEGTPDVSIFIARYKKQKCGQGFCRWKWGRATELVKPINGLPTWNPVFCKQPGTNELLLFYKVGLSPQDWQGRLLRSADDGKTWQGPEHLPAGISGPAKNKCLYNDDGVLLAGASHESGVKNTATLKWTSHVEYSRDNGRTWNRTKDIRFKGRVIQPSLLRDSSGNIRMLMRQRGERRGQHYPNSSVVLAVSDRTGLNWRHRARATNLPCPNAGIDAVTLPDGRMLVVYNDGTLARFNGRIKISVAVSADDGESWKKVLTLVDAGRRPREFSYPAVYLASDGLVHVGFTWSSQPVRPRVSGRENIKHIVLAPSLL